MVVESNIRLFADNQSYGVQGQAREWLRDFAGNWCLESPRTEILPGLEDHDSLVDVEEDEIENVTALMNHVLRVASSSGFGGTGWLKYDPKREGYLSYSMSHGGHLSVYPVAVSSRRMDFTGRNSRARLHLEDDARAFSIVCEKQVDGRWIPGRTWRATRTTH